MLLAVVVGILGMQSLVLVDQECRTLHGRATVASEAVDLGREEKPFRCEGKGDGKATCVSSRSGKASEFRIEQEDKDLLVLRYVGTGEWTAVIRVDKKSGRFQVASSRPMADRGLTAELCVGTATVK